MKIAIASLKYFAYGGLEKDMLRFAECAAKMGHDVTIFTSKWHGDFPNGLKVKILKVRAFSNHMKMVRFSRAFHTALGQESFDATVAFNRIPHCDFYFAADNCYAVSMPGKHPGWMLKILPRYRTFLRLEKDVFSADSATKIFYLAEQQKEDYIRCYKTHAEGFLAVPPGIDPAFRRTPETVLNRKRQRSEWQIADGDIALLFVGSNFRQKGLARIITAAASLPEELKKRCRIMIAGNDDIRPFQKLADASGISSQVFFLGPCDNVPLVMAGSDALLLPAANEATGTVMAEAISTGIPVICSGECGFAPLVEEAGGIVLPNPFRQEDFNAALLRLAGHLDSFRQHAEEYALQVDYTGRAEYMVKAIEKYVLMRNQFRNSIA